MEIKDNRSESQKETHLLAVVGTDKFMSGKICKGKSLAAWAFPSGWQREVFDWVERRHDMSRVRVVVVDGYKPKNAGHLHIYAVDKNHPACPYWAKNC